MRRTDGTNKSNRPLSRLKSDKYGEPNPALPSGPSLSPPGCCGGSNPRSVLDVQRLLTEDLQPLEELDSGNH
jgi:hypothetical protein